MPARTRGYVVGAAACALIACHGGQAHRPGEAYLSAIKFEGNHALSTKDLVAGLALHRTEERGGAPDAYVVSGDSERVRGHYARHGYLEADVRARVELAGQAATVIFKIDEGVRATTRIAITGLPADPALDQAVRGALPLADGAPFDYDTYDLAKPLLLGVVEDAGYAHATLDAAVQVDHANHQAIIELTYDTGPVCRFGEVKIDGVTGELAGAVDQRIDVIPGDRFTTAALNSTQRAIYGMGRFSNVRITPDKSGGAVIPVTVSVSEGARHETRLGGGFGIDPLTYEARLRAGYTIHGFPTPLTTFGVELRPAYALLRVGSTYEPRIRALASLTRMDLFAPYLVGQIDAGYNYLVVEAYTTYGPLARVGLTTPIYSQRLKLRVGWRFQYDSFSHLSPLVDAATAHAIGLDRTERVGAYEQSLALDLRDDPIEPHAGAYLEARIAEGTVAAGGGLTFFEAVPEARGYLPIYSTVVAGRLRVGGIFGDVPVTERFYGGGAQGQRGFSERRLAPTVSGMLNGSFTSLPIGGGAMLDTSIEVRQPLGHLRRMGVGGVVFVDGGDVTNTVGELDPMHLHWAAGLGLRLLTIVGAVRADLGFRLNRTGAQEPEPGGQYAFHLSLGEAY